MEPSVSITYLRECSFLQTVQSQGIVLPIDLQKCDNRWRYGKEVLSRRTDKNLIKGSVLMILCPMDSAEALSRRTDKNSIRGSIVIIAVSNGQRRIIRRPRWTVLYEGT
jgi:hypothetical protein